jgi:hypothetical protein
VLQGEGTLNGATQTLPLLYSLPESDFHDITTGGNGTYNATTGYDLVTGRGSPVANLLVDALAGYSSSQPPSSPPASQPPSISGPSSATVAQNGSLTFSSADAITLTDADAGSNSDTLSLSVNDGTLSLGSTTGLTVVSGANGSSSITVSGALSELNAALSGLVYAPDSGYGGSDSLSISVSDPGDSLSASHTVAITVNDPPTVNSPASASLNENTTLTFSAAKKDPITVADPAAGTSTEELTVSAVHGKVKFSTTSGLKVLAGANNSASVTVSGTLAKLNAALNGLVFTPTSGYVGAASFSLSLEDLRTQLSGSATVNVNVNGPPKFSVPGATTLSENTPFAFSTGGNAIGLVDSGAAAGGNVQLALTTGHGTFTLSTTSGISFTAGGNGRASMTIVGSLSNILAALNGLIYTPTAKYTGSATIKLTAKDLTDDLSGSSTISLKITKVTTEAKTAGGYSSTPAARQSTPTAPTVDPEPVTNDSVSAGGDSFGDDYWMGLAAAIEALDRG